MSSKNAEDEQDGNIVSSALVIEEHLTEEKIQRISQAYERLCKLPLRTKIIIIVLVIITTIALATLDSLFVSISFLNAWLDTKAKGNATAQIVL